MEELGQQVPVMVDTQVVWRCLSRFNKHRRCTQEKRNGVWGPPQPLNFGQPVMYGYCDECRKYQAGIFPDTATVSDEEAAKTAEVINGCVHWCLSCGKAERNGVWEFLPGGPLMRIDGKVGYENGRLFVGEPEPNGGHCPDCPDPLLFK